MFYTAPIKYKKYLGIPRNKIIPLGQKWVSFKERRNILLTSKRKKGESLC
jgi:hypothetical protein